MVRLDDPLVSPSLTDELRTFVKERDWQTFHDPKNLAMLLASEVGELVALFRWVDNREADAFAGKEPNREKISAEIADVAISLLLLVDRMGVDLPAVIREKIEVNRRNYPVDVARGASARPPR